MKSMRPNVHILREYMILAIDAMPHHRPDIKDKCAQVLYLFYWGRSTAVIRRQKAQRRGHL